jgi:hypothetical protein
MVMLVRHTRVTAVTVHMVTSVVDRHTIAAATNAKHASAHSYKPHTKLFTELDISTCTHSDYTQ